MAETEEWKKEEQRLVKELSEGAQGQEGTRLVSLTRCFCCSELVSVTART